MMNTVLKFFAREIGKGVAIFALVGGIAVLALAYSEPTSGPVGGAVYAPVNTSGNPQTKVGNFTSSGTLTGGTVNANPNLCISGSCASSWSQAVSLGGGGGGGGQWTTAGFNIYNANSGNVGIGTTNPGYKLQVGNPFDGTQARANAWNTLSDMRLKENVVKLDGALDKISSINGYYFNWKGGTDTRRHVGVISQEVETVLPEIISVDPEGFKSLDYGKLAPLLIEAIKEQQKEIETLKARINELEKK